MSLPNSSDAARALQKLGAEAIRGTPAARKRASHAARAVSPEAARKRASHAARSVSPEAAHLRARKAAAARWGKKLPEIVTSVVTPQKSSSQRPEK